MIIVKCKSGAARSLTNQLYWLLGLSVLKTGAFVKYGRVKKLWSYVALEQIPHVASTTGIKRTERKQVVEVVRRMAVTV